VALTPIALICVYAGLRPSAAQAGRAASDGAALGVGQRADRAVQAEARTRGLRALLRHRISLVRLGTRLRDRIHAVAADHGYDRSASYWTGPGRGWLAGLDPPAASREIVTDCLAVIDGLAPLIGGSTASCTSTPRPTRA
jgi:hypothetical protein